MGSKQGGLFIIFFTYLQFIASSTPLHKAFISDSLQEHNFGLKGRHELGIDRVKGDDNGRSGIAHTSKFAHGGVTGGHPAEGHGANGGGSNGAAENGNGGSGGAVIPVIVAGAASNHHPSHHGSASSNQNSVGLPALIMITLVNFFAYILSEEFGTRT